MSLEDSNLSGEDLSGKAFGSVSIGVALVVDSSLHLDCLTLLEVFEIGVLASALSGDVVHVVSRQPLRRRPCRRSW